MGGGVEAPGFGLTVGILAPAHFPLIVPLRGCQCASLFVSRRLCDEENKSAGTAAESSSPAPDVRRGRPIPGRRPGRAWAAGTFQTRRPFRSVRPAFTGCCVSPGIPGTFPPNLQLLWNKHGSRRGPGMPGGVCAAARWRRIHGEKKKEKRKLAETSVLELPGAGEASRATPLQQPRLKAIFIPANTLDFPVSEDWSRDSASSGTPVPAHAHASTMDALPSPPPPVFPAGLCRYCYS